MYNIILNYIMYETFNSFINFHTIFVNLYHLILYFYIFVDN